MKFPEKFLWGSATSSYQIEGSPAKNGTAHSIWDDFCLKEGAVWNGHNGSVACDHYHRFIEDIKVMKDIGLQSYRFSISWPRIFPGGTGTPEQDGLDFYSCLVDELLSSHIIPFVTLYHWDYPSELYRRGGWLNPDSPNWFSDYVTEVVTTLGDRVKNWITFNEPQIFIGLGYGLGKHAPGETLDLKSRSIISHHVLLAHGKAVQAIRAASKQICKIGYAPVGITSIPLTQNAEDIEAARIRMFEHAVLDDFNNTWWFDPVLSGKYPETIWEARKGNVPEIKNGDMELISQPIDFLGLNIYTASRVKAGADGKPEEVPFPPGWPVTSFAWPITPETLYWGPKFFYERYGLPLYITENGMANPDIISLDGQVHDPQRIDYLHRHLKNLGKAIEEGIDCRGYFLWSLMDNFEWEEGYKQRFGIVFVDFSTQKRIMKESAQWYSKVISSQGSLL